MDETLQQAARWREEGKRVALASVVATRRSAPRPIGSKLVVSEQGELAGSVSGGCVESDVVVAAQEVLAGGEPRLVTYGITDDMALGIGLPCGGEIDVFVEELRDAERPDVTLTVVEGEGVGERLHDPGLEQAARRRGRSHAFPLGERTVFADVDAPPPRLFVYGAVDTAEALCRAAKLLGWSTVVADARASFATPERIPSADELLVVWPDEALAHVGPDVDTAVLVLTHDDKFDLPLLEAVLRTDAFYVGALGSRRNQERRRGLLLERGVDEDDLDRIAGPAGLDLGADTPAETALSMLAEILAVRAGRAGGRLRESPHRIHAEPVS
ncbi:MAG TPA: XdhC/CoxI family protein [Gaiellaceae bacterium]|nr:XdhC/CoxI family protein [Gaiellaceae bacterium]